MRESCFDKVDDPAYLPNHRYLSLVSPGNRDPVDYHHGLVIDTGGLEGKKYEVWFSFFLSMSKIMRSGSTFSCQC